MELTKRFLFFSSVFAFCLLPRRYTSLYVCLPASVLWHHVIVLAFDRAAARLRMQNYIRYAPFPNVFITDIPFLHLRPT